MLFGFGNKVQIKISRWGPSYLPIWTNGLPMTGFCKDNSLISISFWLIPFWLIPIFPNFVIAEFCNSIFAKFTQHFFYYMHEYFVSRHHYDKRFETKHKKVNKLILKTNNLKNFRVNQFWIEMRTTLFVNDICFKFSSFCSIN